MGSEAVRLDARLALTQRYTACKPSEEVPSAGLVKRLEEAAAESSRARLPEVWGTFKLHPPTLSIINSVERLASLSREEEPCEGRSILTLLMQILDKEEGRVWASTMHWESAKEGCSRSDRPRKMQLIQTIRRLVRRLLQQSVESRRAEDLAREVRARHMSDGARDRLSGSPQRRCTRAVEDASALVESSDFQPLYFCRATTRAPSGRPSEENPEDLRDEAQAALLFARMLLRCQALFFVTCSGAAHIGAFLRLAMFAGLQLELLPSREQLTSILK